MHGHRVIGVVIDKAIQWKERTMKAKWLWMTWAYLAVVLLIALELFFILFNLLFLLPKYQKLRHDGIIDPAMDEKLGVGWMTRFLAGLGTVAYYTVYLLLAAIAAWGLFEWRVKSENKSFIRFAVLGTVAVALMVVVMLTTSSQMIQFYGEVPAMGRLARPWNLEQVSTIDASISSLEQALAKKDWEAMREPAEQASNALSRLWLGPLSRSVASGNEPMTVEDLLAHLGAARFSLQEAQQAIRDKDAERLEAALKKFHKAFEPVQEAAKRSAK